jgi:hypothetical protein
MRDLQAFLIKRFIYILVLVTVAQSLISFLISQAVMPVVIKINRSVFPTDDCLW